MATPSMGALAPPANSYPTQTDENDARSSGQGILARCTAPEYARLQEGTMTRGPKKSAIAAELTDQYQSQQHQEQDARNHHGLSTSRVWLPGDPVRQQKGTISQLGFQPRATASACYAAASQQAMTDTAPTAEHKAAATGAAAARGASIDDDAAFAAAMHREEFGLRPRTVRGGQAACGYAPGNLDGSLPAFIPSPAGLRCRKPAPGIQRDDSSSKSGKAGFCSLKGCRVDKRRHRVGLPKNIPKVGGAQ